MRNHCPLGQHMPSMVSWYGKSHTYKRFCFETACMSSILFISPTVSRGTQLTQLAIQYSTVIGRVLFTQIICYKTQNKTTFILQYSTLKSTVVRCNSWHTGAGMSEQARKVTDWRTERRWEMVERKDHQQQKTEGKLQFHSSLTLMECTFTSLKSPQLEGSYIGDLL